MKRDLHLNKIPRWSVCPFFVIFCKLDWHGQQEEMHVEGA